MLVARIVLVAFVGPCPERMECCHNDGDETNNRLANLRWDTHSANLLDKRRHGTMPCGERHPKAKLSDMDIAEILRLGQAGEGHTGLARRFGVSGARIGQIIKKGAR